MSIWLISFIFFIILEAVTTGLVSIWFAVGSLGAIITNIFTDNIIIQCLVFIVSSLGALAFTKPILNKYYKNKIVPTNLDVVIGKTGLVTKEIDMDNIGEVLVAGKKWSAIIDSSSKIKTFPVDSKVKILSIEGVKLIVKEEE